MGEQTTPRLWTQWLMFVVICGVLILIQLLPFQGIGEHNRSAGSTLRAPDVVWAPPDLILAVSLAWSARRPDYVPVLLLAFVLFMSDILLQRPPGLMTALVIVLSEALRSRAILLRSLPFWVEWGMVSIGVIIVATFNRGILSLVEVPQSDVFLTVTQAIFTCLVYPAVALVSHLLLRVSRPAPGQVDALGHRL